MEKYTCDSKGGNHQKPQTHPTAARIKDERWRSAGPGFEPGRAGPRLSLKSSHDNGNGNGNGNAVT
jgi:hypothetical protein